MVNDKIAISLMSRIPQALVSFSLYYFVFEMKLIRITLVASSHEDYNSEKKFESKVKFAILSFFSLVVAMMLGMSIYISTLTNVYIVAQYTYASLIIIKVLIDFYFFFSFAMMFNFFWTRKKQ